MSGDPRTLKEKLTTQTTGTETTKYEDAVNEVRKLMPNGCKTVPKDWQPNLTRAERRKLASTARGTNKKSKHRKKRRKRK